MEPAPRILLVDDEPLVLRAVARQLSRYLRVRTALGAEEALRALEESAEVEGFLFDMQMDPVDGPELFARVVARWPELRARAAVVTGAADSDEVRAFAAREGVHVIAKPFNSANLLAWLSAR